MHGDKVEPDSHFDPPEDDADADAAEQHAEESFDHLEEDYPIEDRDCDYWNRTT